MCVIHMFIYVYTHSRIYVHATHNQVLLLREIQGREIERKQAKRKAGNGELQRREKGQWRSQECGEELSAVKAS